MRAFRLKLEQALGSGAALALLTLPACGGVSSEGSASAGAAGAPPAPGAAGSVAAVAGTAGTANTVGGANAGGPATNSAGMAGDANQPLAPYPENALGCAGPVQNGGYYGQCCARALCYTPDQGDECVAPDEASAKLGKSYGSGSCLCSSDPTKDDADAIQGPFAPNPTHQPQQPGTCCYVISSISCEGRPLLVEGVPLLSALERRNDWLLREVLELTT